MPENMLSSVLIALLLGLTVSIILLPVALPLAVSFSSSYTIAFPPQGFTLRWFTNIFYSESLINGFKFSLVLGISASLIAMIISLPATYIFYRYNFKSKSYLENLMLSPSLVPEIVLSFTLLVYFNALKISYSSWLLLGHILILIPYATRYTYASLVNLDTSIEDAAISLGANRLRAFLDVIVPNIAKGLAASFLLSFIISFNAFSISLFLSYGETLPLPIAMWNYLQVRYDPTVAAMSTILVIFTLTLSIIVRRIVELKGVK
ncbi:MAG: ABC transporter permease [Desulfurococcales archaeon]|nr:ABC transporter permease [Desulfurococcales archaeon]